MSDCTGTGSENPFDLNVPVDDTPHIPASAHFCTSTVNPFSSPFAASNLFAEYPISFQPTILIKQVIDLPFDPHDTASFFRVFEVHYFDQHLNDEQLFYKLVKTMKSSHFQQVSSYADSCSYAMLKNGVIATFADPLHQRYEQLCNAPALGDRRPSQMLFDLKRILGPHELSKDQTAEWFLRTQFLSRLPTDVQHILAAFQNASIEELAKTADSVISSQNTSFKCTNMPNSSTLATPACSLRRLDQSYLSELTAVKQQLNSLQMQLNQSLSSASYSTVPQHRRPQSFPHQNYMRRGAPSFNRPRFPGLSFRPPFSRPPVPSTTRQELVRVDGLCYYHRKYPSSARHCLPGCSRYDEHLQQASLPAMPSSQASFHYQITTAAAGTSHQYDSYIHLQDIHNNIKFIVDTASPKSILPVSLFPSFATQHISSSCPSLFAANGIALQQAGSLELTLHFSEFPNRHFTHTFILAQIECPILGLDFLSRYHFTINASLKTVDCEKDVEYECKNDSQSLLQPIDFDTFSFEEILQLFPDVTSGHIKIGKKLHPFEHILEVSGPPVTFRPLRLNAEKQKELDAILDDLLAKR